jgi:DNA-binding transcriptional ArsR family regulator
MVEYQERRLDSVYGALADGHRRKMLQRLSRGTLTISELADPLPISLAAASKHIQILERAGLVRRDRSGRTHHITLVEKPLHDAADWALKTAEFWERTLDQLEQYLNPGTKR